MEKLVVFLTEPENLSGGELSTLYNKPHREICALCHEVSRIGYHVPNDVWDTAVHTHWRNDIICLQCFTRVADEKGVEWDREITFHPISWITHVRAIALATSSRRRGEVYAAYEEAAKDGYLQPPPTIPPTTTTEK